MGTVRNRKMDFSSVATFLLAAVHSLFAFTHLKDPVEAVVMMIQIESRALADSATVHCVAIIGCLHAFLGLLFMMIAFTKDPSMRKCVLGIYLFTFVPLGVTTQFWFPIKGPGTEPPLAPESFLKMPLALITGMGLLAFAGI